MPKPEPLTDAEAAEVRKLHAEGKGRNEIHRITGLTNARITRYTTENDLKFAGHNTPGLKKAQAQRQQNMRERREQIAQRLAGRAESILDRLEGKYRYYERGQGGNEMVLVELPEHPLREEQTGIQAVATAMKSYMEIAETLVEKTAADEKSMLDRLREQMKVSVAAEDAAKEPAE